MSHPESEEDLKQLQWIDLQNDIDAAYETDNFFTKMKKKTDQNPFIPIGKTSVEESL